MGSAPWATKTSSTSAMRAAASSSVICSSARSRPMWGERLSFPSVIAPAPPVRPFSSRTRTERVPASVRATNIPAGPAPTTATSQVFSAAIRDFLEPRAAGEPEREDGHPRPGKERLDRLAIVRVPEETEEHPAPARAAQLRAAHQAPEPAVWKEFLHA